jgi:hypothetical protein
MSGEGATTEQMASMTITDATTTAAGAGGKSTVKRDALRENEIAVQALWKEAKAFEADPDATKESFLVTFPYPYSNGHLHIGHAFSLTKAVFRAQYERHLGKNVLFPFAFHCTGMPIQAVRIITKRVQGAPKMGALQKKNVTFFSSLWNANASLVFFLTHMYTTTTKTTFIVNRRPTSSKPRLKHMAVHPSFPKKIRPSWPQWRRKWPRPHKPPRMRRPPPTIDRGVVVPSSCKKRARVWCANGTF